MTNTTFRSVFWTGAERFGSQFFQAVFTIVLARLLMPADFGLLAMIFIFLMIGQMLVDGGLSLALIQKKNPTEEDFSTVFWFNLGFGLFFYIVFFLCAPLIAEFYEQPQLILITKIAGLSIIIRSLGIVHGSKLTIALNFKRQAIIAIFSMVLSGIIGVALAFYSYGVWALVVQFLINNLLRTLCFWFFGTSWYPRFIFCVNSFKSLFKFGYGYMLTSLLDVLYKNMFAVFIGKRYSPQELGFFQQASSLTNLATTNIVYTVAGPFIPLQSKLHDTPKEQHKTFERFLSLACFLVFPIAILFAILAEPFVSFVLTEKWLPAVPLMQIFCLGYIWYPILVINRFMLLAKGLSKQNLISEIIAKTFGVAAFLICLPHGIAWICVSIGFYAFFDMIIALIFSQKKLSIRWTEQLKIIFPVFGLAVFSGVVTWLTTLGVAYYTPTWDFGKLLFGGLVGIGIYTLGAHLLKFDEFKFMLNYLKKTK
jgi:O-antigen/teichoic acid export membrane protein